jgi:hypothetical protein
VKDVASSKPPRRWSKRSLVLIVSGLAVGVLALVTSIVGVTRSAAFVLHAVDEAGDARRIAPERTTGASTPVAVTGDARLPLTPTSSGVPIAVNGSSQPASVSPSSSSTPQAGGSNGGADADGQVAAVGGIAGVGGGGSSGGVGGSADAAGASPAFWESVAQSALALLGQTTISMCGPNTCNVGQVCCNASCGICTARGATCDQTQCAGAPRAPTNILCGRGQCNDGQICCNPSCGICVAPGETCSEEPCRQ